jgi:hypothetical protein
MSQLCDSIESRLTVRTGGSAKGEILAVELGKEQRDRVKNRKTVIKGGHNNRLQSVTNTKQDITTG